MPTPRPMPRPKPQPPPCHLWAEAEVGSVATAIAAVAAMATIVLRNMGVSPFWGAGCFFHILMPSSCTALTNGSAGSSENLDLNYLCTSECSLMVWRPRRAVVALLGVPGAYGQWDGPDLLERSG